MLNIYRFYIPYRYFSIFHLSFFLFFFGRLSKQKSVIISIYALIWTIFSIWVYFHRNITWVQQGILWHQSKQVFRTCNCGNFQTFLVHIFYNFVWFIMSWLTSIHVCHQHLYLSKYKLWSTRCFHVSHRAIPKCYLLNIVDKNIQIL